MCWCQASVLAEMTVAIASLDSTCMESSVTEGPRNIYVGRVLEIRWVRNP